MLSVTSAACNNKPASPTASNWASEWNKNYKFVVTPHYLYSSEESLGKQVSFIYGSINKQSSYDRNKASNML